MAQYINIADARGQYFNMYTLTSVNGYAAEPSSQDPDTNLQVQQATVYNGTTYLGWFEDDDTGEYTAGYPAYWLIIVTNAGGSEGPLLYVPFAEGQFYFDNGAFLSETQATNVTTWPSQYPANPGSQYSTGANATTNPGNSSGNTPGASTTPGTSGNGQANPSNVYGQLPTGSTGSGGTNPANSGTGTGGNQGGNTNSQGNASIPGPDTSTVTNAVKNILLALAAIAAIMFLSKNKK